MYKRIVLPIDLNSKFKKPSKFAIELSKKFSSKIIILNVIEDYVESKHSIMSRVSLDSINTDYDKLKTSNLLLVKERFSEFSDLNLDLDFKVKKGDAAQIILDLSISISADLIIMGSNGKDNISDYFMGTTSSKVVKNSTLPVLVVPNTE